MTNITVAKIFYTVDTTIDIAGNNTEDKGGEYNEQDTT